MSTDCPFWSGQARREIDAGEGLLRAGGDYAMAAPASLLLKKYSDAIPTDVAGLRGARVVVASETPEDGRLDETRVKLLTGAGGKITARYMRQDYFEFNPTHHLFLQTNHKPRIVGTDFAIWRRVRLLPFDVIFEEVTADNPTPTHPADPLLDGELRAELPGILVWAVEGAKEWFRGRTPRSGVRARSDQDLPARRRRVSRLHRIEMRDRAQAFGDCWRFVRCLWGVVRG